MQPCTQKVHAYLKALQDNLVSALESEEDSRRTFLADPWEHQGGGGGLTCVMEGGHVIEKAGVNFSHVQGTHLPPSAISRHPHLSGCDFEAMGVSVIIHPRCPFAPTTHFNVRFFIAQSQDHKQYWWFGGGFDLTPYYGFAADCKHWHKMAESACKPFGKDLYPRFKAWADRYFYLKHRKEYRGIGGLFFDDLKLQDFDTTFAFVRSVGDHFLAAYLPILQKRKNMPYTQKARDFQCYRRGRYVEFNLIHDRGTLFGLQSGGRTESILISLPPCVNWHYRLSPDMQTEQACLHKDFLTPKNWLA